MSLDEAQLGQLLLGFSLGAITSMMIVGQLIDRYKSDRFSLLGGVTFGICVCMMPFTDTTEHLALIVVATGVGFGTLDVSMNTTASNIGRQARRHMMSSFHATFSVGNLLGAVTMGKIISYGGTLKLCMGTAGALVVLLAALSYWLNARRYHEAENSFSASIDVAISTKLGCRQFKLILLFGSLALVSMLAEGGVMDWSGIFLVKTFAASESVGAYAFAIFAGSVALGRILGDRLTLAIGLQRAIQLGGAVCATSVFVMLVCSNVQAALVTLAVCGFGIANINPAIFAAAGSIGSDSTGKAMSIVKSMGYVGLLIGPVLLGFLAKKFDLGVSFLLVALAFASIATFSIFMPKRTSGEHS